MFVTRKKYLALKKAADEFNLSTLNYMQAITPLLSSQSVGAQLFELEQLHADFMIKQRALTRETIFRR